MKGSARQQGNAPRGEGHAGLGTRCKVGNAVGVVLIRSK